MDEKAIHGRESHLWTRKLYTNNKALHGRERFTQTRKLYMRMNEEESHDTGQANNAPLKYSSLHKTIAPS